MDLELAGRTYLITGGTDGLGLALATTLVREGALVAVCGRDPQRISRAQSSLGPDALCFGADVTDPEQVDAFVDATLQRFGRLDGAVNNAGRSAGSSVATSEDAAWRDDYEMKVIAALHVSRRVLEPLAASKGAVINVLAVQARTPAANSTPSSASRAAGLALTKALAQEVGAQGVRVNAILIGLVESGQWVRRAEDARVSADEYYRKMAADSRIPLGRFGHAQEFADLAAFLLSPRASYVTGVGIALDGGLSPAI